MAARYAGATWSPEGDQKGATLADDIDAWTQLLADDAKFRSSLEEARQKVGAVPKNEPFLQAIASDLQGWKNESSTGAFQKPHSVNKNLLSEAIDFAKRLVDNASRDFPNKLVPHLNSADKRDDETPSTTDKTSLTVQSIRGFKFLS